MENKVSIESVKRRIKDLESALAAEKEKLNYETSLLNEDIPELHAKIKKLQKKCELFQAEAKEAMSDGIVPLRLTNEIRKQRASLKHHRRLMNDILNNEFIGKSSFVCEKWVSKIIIDAIQAGLLKNIESISKYVRHYSLGINLKEAKLSKNNDEIFIVIVLGKNDYVYRVLVSELLMLKRNTYALT